jgi:hypothetical protein
LLYCTGIILAISTGSATANEVNREGAEALMAHCQRQRAQHIAPLKEQAIEDCLARNMQDREACEHRHRNFGERQQGGQQAGMFWDLPDCQQATAAERYFRMYPGRNTFELPEPTPPR